MSEGNMAVAEALEISILDIPYFSQREEEAVERYGRKACGLTSLRMVVDFYRRPSDLAKLDSLAQGTGAYTEQSGWSHAGLINTARKLGLSGYRINYGFIGENDLGVAEEVFRSEGANENDLENFRRSFSFARVHGALEDIKRLLEEERTPVILSMKKSYAKTLASHLIVVKGVDKDTGDFIVNDPWDFGPNHHVIQEDLTSHWTNRAIVITDPQKAV